MRAILLPYITVYGGDVGLPALNGNVVSAIKVDDADIIWCQGLLLQSLQPAENVQGPAKSLQSKIKGIFIIFLNKVINDEKVLLKAFYTPCFSAAKWILPASL